MTERVLPRDFPVPPELIVPLDRAELQELGTFVAIWAQVDWIVEMLVAHLIHTSVGHAHMIMETMTTGPRIGLLKKLSQGTDPVQTAIRRICDDNSGLIEDRNQIVHGLWAVEWFPQTGETHAACLSHKHGRKAIAAEKLTLLSERAAALSNALGMQLEKLNPQWSGARPRQFLFGSGPPGGTPPPAWPPPQ